jgi:hypothetical protein
MIFVDAGALVLIVLACLGAFMWWTRHQDGVKDRRQLQAQNDEMHSLVSEVYTSAKYARDYEPNLADTVLAKIRATETFGDDPRYQELQ